MKWGNCHELFSIFFIENELFTENVKKGVRGNEPNGRTVQPTHLILISIEAEFRALIRISFQFSSNTIFVSENAFLPKKLKFQTVLFFFRIPKLKQKFFYIFVDHKLPLLMTPISVLQLKTVRVRFFRRRKNENFRESDFSADIS